MPVHDRASLLRQALAAEQAGNTARAKELAVSILQSSPKDASLLNDTGSLLNRLGEPAQAAKAFRKALDLTPDALDIAINLAIALTGSGRAEEGLRLLVQREQVGKGQARYWSVRANAARGARDLGEAARCYDKALELEPGHKRALQGRAQVALERADDRALAFHDAALRLDPGNPYLWRGKAEALDAAGDRETALAIARQIVQQAPRWTEGLELLAQLRLGAGDANFADHYGRAAQAHPDDPNIPAAWIEVLAGLDHYEQAARVAAQAAARFPQIERFTLLEAVQSGNAGDDDRAERIYAALDLDTADRHIHEARHRIRRGEYRHAERALDQAARENAWGVSLWALRGILWRLADDPRQSWLHGQEGLWRKLPLPRADRILPQAVERLHAIHDRAALPLGQSLRGGTQTRGNLFERIEPVFGELQQAIEEAVEQYRVALPLADDTHPLLRHRDENLRFAGSWSVRLTGGGDHHTAHIHPQGIVSSALYLVVPDGGVGEGALELGRPPPDLRLDLSPLATLRPEPGHLVLFPSTLYHGTTAFSGATRMTIAFDVVAGEAL